jgi:3-hydroxyacyl-[acyl-carrier-protein] dehydratase
MLKDDFYTIKSINSEGNATSAALVINGAHKIFEGHFPGQPVVPGVCLVQMVREITAVALERDVQMTKADEVKFLQIIDPRENKVLNMHLRYNSTSDTDVNVSAILSKDELTCFKFKGSFRISHPKK